MLTFASAPGRNVSLALPRKSSGVDSVGKPPDITLVRLVAPRLGSKVALRTDVFNTSVGCRVHLALAKKLAWSPIGPEMPPSI